MCKKYKNVTVQPMGFLRLNCNIRITIILGRHLKEPFYYLTELLLVTLEILL